MFFGRKEPFFIWDRVNRRKVEAHQVEPEEVEEVFEDPDRYIRRSHSGATDHKRYFILGRTYSGRLLKVPFEVLEDGVRPVTAFNAGKRDYALYWKRR